MASGDNKNPQATPEDVLASEVLIPEAYLVGLFWSYPEYYTMYSEERLSTKTFANKEWGFFYGVGQRIAAKGIRVFDDISTQATLNELGVQFQDYYENKCGGYKTIGEVMIEVSEKKDNFDAYYNDVKKYELLRELRKLIGDKVVTSVDKYNYKKMSKEDIHTYWADKINNIGLANDGSIVEQYLLDGLDEFLAELDSDPDIGMPLYDSKLMNEICSGWAYGNVYIYGAFSGRGKTSLTFNKIVMSCLFGKEQLLVIANEQSIKEFRKMLFVTLIGQLHDMDEEGLTKFSRKRLNKGGFSDEENAIIIRAREMLHAMTEGNNKLIAFVFLEDYTIENVKKVLRKFAARGFRRVVIDTAKPSEGSPNMVRWERFTEDFKDIYKLARPDAGGLDLAIWCNVQLADTVVGRRFLDFSALGDSKKIKNEASLLFMSRPVFDDEYKGGKNELKAYQNRTDPINGEWYKHPIDLDPAYGPYYLLFTAKNRRGLDNDNGLDILVMKPNFNYNTWHEIGWCSVAKDYGF